jgi:UDP-2,3-diacylglucosamine pyrophosphatase LpxH
MLIVISDLHLSDGTSGKHSPPPDAFGVMLDDMTAFAKKVKPANITLLLLGDIFDVLRSTKWFEDDGAGPAFPEADRPWGVNGLKNVNDPMANSKSKSKTEQRCLEILGRFPTSGKKAKVTAGTILSENWDILEMFRNIQTSFPSIPTKVVYVPGNHDRLCNLYPSVRDEVAKILYGTAVSPPPKSQIMPNSDWWFNYEYHDADLKVFARHGHQYDVFNYGHVKTFDRKAHLQASIGDVITTEFLVRLPWQVEYNNRKQKNAEINATISGLGDRLRDIDNIRPFSAALKWFYYRIRSQQAGAIRDSLDKAFDDVAKNMLGLAFVQKWNSPDSNIDEIVRFSASPWVKWISESILTRLGAETLLPVFLKLSDGSEDCYLEASYEDIKRYTDVDYVIYGHTHNPLHQPIDALEGRDIIYLNSGTWRRRVTETSRLDKSPDFVSVQAMTYITIYKGNAGVTCDMWNGIRK